MVDTRNYIRQVIDENRNGEQSGLFSVCSANEYVIRSAVRYAKKHQRPVIFEATANQVNQFGGYTGMEPVHYKDLVQRIAQEEGMDPGLFILGGDHLGPLVWSSLPEKEAMVLASQLVRDYTLAGFSKIHLDTSMRLGDDDPHAPLPLETSARRAALLAKVVDQALAEQADAGRPVLILGSEVPVPGGSQDHADHVAVTKAEDFQEQFMSYRAIFDEEGLSFDDVVAFVVQPGVEFGDDFVLMYEPEAASALVKALKDCPGVAFEGHSTDYQTADKLRSLVADGVAILKVGPALTFAVREALFLLEEIERILIRDTSRLSAFKACLRKTMDSKPEYWDRYYSGSSDEIDYKKMYSYSDRSRYYMADKAVLEAIGKMMGNLQGSIPPALISQYFPRQYARFMAGEMDADALSLICDRVADVLDDYAFACGWFD